jgi:hypothetical protein
MCIKKVENKLKQKEKRINRMKINKIKSNLRPVLLMVVVSLFLLPSIYAATIKINENINLVQTCNNCTYCNITKILNPSQFILLTNLVMTKDGSSYNYTLNSTYTNAIGTYEWFYICGNLEESETGKLTFNVNPSGYSNNLIFFYIVGLIVPWLLFLLGLWKKDMTFAILGTIGFYLIALYLLIMGVDGNRDWLTNGIGIIHLGVAFYTSIVYTLESIDINW